MHYLDRLLEPRIMEALEHFPVVTIQGARQVGKSTLVAHLPIENLTTVTFDPVQDVGRAREDPDFFLQNQSFPLFLDEIQYAPELTASIKRLVDERGQNGLILLSGSQNLAVLRSISESMAGRAAVLDLYPLALNEIEHRTATDGVLAEVLRGGGVEVESRSWRAPHALYPRIWAGGMPGLLELPEHLYALSFESYQRTYVERDVRTAADVSSL